MKKPRSDEISILKTIWNKTKDGKWGIHDLKSIPLNPRDGFSKDYFRIQDDLVLMTQRPGGVMENFFTSFGGTEFLLRQSIVPIVARVEGEDEIRCIGTGFFISASGLLLTAAHVIRDPIEEKYMKPQLVDIDTYKMSEGATFGVLLPANPAMKNAPFGMDPIKRNAKFFIAPFEWMQHWGKDEKSPLLHRKPEFKLDLDIAICKVQQSRLIGPYQPLNIGRHKLNFGDRAVAIGYAEMRNIRLYDDNYQPELFVSVGSVIEIYPDNISEKQNLTPGPNFRFDAKIPGKMSGAPILVGEGIITKGVVSRSWSNDNDSSGCLIAPLMNLPVINGKSLSDMMKSGEEGIAVIKGADL